MLDSRNPNPMSPKAPKHNMAKILMNCTAIDASIPTPLKLCGLRMSALIVNANNAPMMINKDPPQIASFLKEKLDFAQDFISVGLETPVLFGSFLYPRACSCP